MRLIDATNSTQKHVATRWMCWSVKVGDANDTHIRETNNNVAQPSFEGL